MDITANFHGGNECSIEAGQKASLRAHADRKAIHAHAITFGAEGAVADTLFRSLGISENTGAARCSEMKADRTLIRTYRIGRTRTGCKAEMLVAKECWLGETLDPEKPYRSRRRRHDDEEDE